MKEMDKDSGPKNRLDGRLNLTTNITSQHDFRPGPKYLQTNKYKEAEKYGIPKPHTSRSGRG